MKMLLFRGGYGDAMITSKKTLLTLIDEKGKKFIIKKGEGMKQIGGLGVINTDTLNAGSVTIAGKEFAVMEASLPDILAIIKRGPQWIMPKDSAQIMFNCSIGPGNKVLEVGTGSGLIALHCAKAGADVTATDISPLAIKNIRMNALKNKL